MQAFENKLRETGVKKVLDKIKYARRELTTIKLNDLLKLTKLQAAQKRAAHAALKSRQQRQIQV